MVEEATRALVVDDHDSHRRMVCAILESMGAEVAAACDGVEAVAAAKHETFDLILMDVSMPNMDGYAATRLIRDHESATASAGANIVMLTSHETDDAYARSAEAGANWHVTKPVKIADLLAAIESHHAELV